MKTKFILIVKILFNDQAGYVSVSKREEKKKKKVPSFRNVKFKCSTSQQ